MTVDTKLVCVTGASGFIGSHVTKELLDRGYRVRATVRDPDDAYKTEHLHRFGEQAPGRLEVLAADLMERDSFDDIIAGCEHVYHVASPVYMNSKDPQREIVEPAVRGTQGVLSAIAKAGTVKRVGLTSSIAAILRTNPQRRHVYTEDDWNDDATVDTNPYGLSKTLAEREVWRARDALPESERFDLMVVNPVVVTGPVFAKVHTRSSVALVRDLARRKIPACPKLSFGLVDIRDVVEALVNGVERGITGRHILHTQSLWMVEIARVIAERFPQLGVKPRQVPNALTLLFSLVDRRLSLSFLRRNLGRQAVINHDKSIRDLGLRLRPVDESIADTVESLQSLGYI